VRLVGDRPGELDGCSEEVNPGDARRRVVEGIGRHVRRPMRRVVVRTRCASCWRVEEGATLTLSFLVAKAPQFEIVLWIVSRRTGRSPAWQDLA
jgi:hypothetical protein